jgi:hypothetical protein
MLLKNPELESESPFGFHHRNHAAKYRIKFNSCAKNEGVFIADLERREFNKLLFALCMRCLLSAWETWSSSEFCGLDFDDEVQNLRTAWFPSPERGYPDGELDLVLRATEVVKILVN